MGNPGNLKQACWQGGFTLVEVLATLAILSLIIACTTMIMGQSLGIWQTTSVQSVSHLDAQLGLNYLARDLRLATSVTLPDESSPNTENSLKLKQGTKEIEYSLDAGALIRSVNGVKIPVVDGLQGFSVRRISSRTYSITVTVQANSEEFQLTSQVSPRARD